ncbi:Putative RNA-binding protein Luc7-like 1 [Myotis brandtii]|uniref:Putative RNA-binding protein Luc7-like 1 n=1 Tax=Myotis brandtii TaxID=109478 RepID=S7N2P5_MYOBR|nr:Putative RNA-binding protein Luc7-like 1 [Myotis brandtii]
MNATRKSSLGLKINVRFVSGKARSNLIVQIPQDGDETRQRVKFTDDRVCKSHLLDCCPHDILAGTRMDLGECTKIHDLALRADYEIASKERDLFFELDAHGLLAGVTAAGQAESETAQSVTDSPVCEGTASGSSSETCVPVLRCAQVPVAMDHLESFIAECDRRTELAKKRLAETQEEISAEVSAKAEKVHELNEEIGKLLAKAEQLGAEGNVDESQKILMEVEKVRAKKKEAEVGLLASLLLLLVPVAITVSTVKRQHHLKPPGKTDGVWEGSGVLVSVVVWHLWDPFCS